MATRLAGLGVLFLGFGALTAQEPPLRRIGPAESELRESFTSVTAIRVLSDGRILVADSRDRVLQLVDFRTGTARKVGREGAGPGEYGIPQNLTALPGDTTLLYDPMNGRLLLILPDGTPGGLLGVDAIPPASRGPPRAADPRGGFYYELSRPVEPGGLYEASRVDVVRYDRATGRIDTLTTLQLPERRSSGARSLPGGMLQRFTNKPLAGQDVAAYAPDGRVAVVRVRDYRVEWLGGAARVQGPATSYRALRVTSAEREAFLASQRTAGSIIVRGPAGGGTPAPGAPRAAPEPRGSDPFADQPVEWPDHKPPFLAGAARVAPDGRLWVLTTRAHDDPVPGYDVFDAAGRRVERVALPPRTRLAGFGSGVVYLVRSDEDDLQWLGRYRL